MTVALVNAALREMSTDAPLDVGADVAEVRIAILRRLLVYEQREGKSKTLLVT